MRQAFIVGPTSHGEGLTEAYATAGGKARALAELAAADVAIPPWFVVLPSATADSLTLGEDAAQELERVMDLMPAGACFAVRSSAADEDGAGHSFAGQLDSFLFVNRADVPHMIAKVWASGRSERVMAYRRERGLPEDARPPAVIVQQMVEADSAGVAFSADPVSGDRGLCVVSAVYGLGSGLVSGECEADTWRVNQSGEIVERAILRKTHAHRGAPGQGEGVAPEKVPDDLQHRPVLDDASILRVAELARRASDHFGKPQDIEWAIANGTLWLLQSRPITSLGKLADPGGRLAVWDNSNIAESYNGITTPLTFSFARGVYEEVYRQFCRIMGVSGPRIATAAGTFRCMLGYICGRVYYNLLNWYRVLALLPGFQINRAFMEQMMGVSQGLPQEILDRIAAEARRSKFSDTIDLIRCVVGLVAQSMGLDRSIRRFHRRLDQALQTPPDRLGALRLDELVAEYRKLEVQLLQHWDAPLVNDFFAMIHYGTLRKLCMKWCGDTDGTLHNALVTGGGGIVSAEPATRLSAMAREVRRIDGLAETLRTKGIADCKKAIGAHPALRAQVASYLDKFGERCLEELKLESLTLLDDPTLFYRSLGRLAAQEQEHARRQTSGNFREEAETRVRVALQKNWLRQAVFSWVLKNARERIRQRENLRFERTRVFGRVRRIFLEIGKRLSGEGVLNDPRDVFYLTVDEVLGFAEGTAVAWDLREIAALRKKELEVWRAGPAPTGRFETRGAPPIGNTFQRVAGTAGAYAPAFQSAESADSLNSGDQKGVIALHGIGCCPGIVSGTARVILNPHGATIEPGEILVAPRTDPGWIMLFPSAAGLLVEFGSLLSHSAIVARELGLPAVVSIPELTARLKTGDWVRFDGATGRVEVRPASPN